MNFWNQPSMLFKYLLLLIAVASLSTNAFSTYSKTASSSQTISRTTTLYAKKKTTPAGPIARAKKAMDPADYNRVVERKMFQEKLTREEAEEEYNNFLENPSFYYALDKKESYYKKMGYKNMLDGIVGEAEKEGRGEEVRERIDNFKRESKIKAYSVLVFFVVGFWYARSVYLADPDNFLTGL
mmetsp:Transcript_18512/g.25473  ORF Transcript_18512/g.25473 Transcript_18512/m.25473 type:complete len:183 (-) Transcript_18512:188-736(-)|eukprot:CAMPEP_0185736812 /NCGR_PEP_ID=MMETSP1171-20130828/28851_1 /TAXON_ID=374046 /ORGANISM="Helicotheca tamensis, Strain CCMP826" /LENGTH=182 /DNA_ID=CAMNT_0028407549 /DNA_START=48 /DNA_END=596 /DNA_ORIENTATION=+